MFSLIHLNCEEKNSYLQQGEIPLTKTNQQNLTSYSAKEIAY